MNLKVLDEDEATGFWHWITIWSQYYEGSVWALESIVVVKWFERMYKTLGYISIRPIGSPGDYIGIRSDGAEEIIELEGSTSALWLHKEKVLARINTVICYHVASDHRERILKRGMKLIALEDDWMVPLMMEEASEMYHLLRMEEIKEKFVGSI